MDCCREVMVLRTFVQSATRHRATQRLLTKYAVGRRAAADVADGLAALLAQLQYEEASALLDEALLAVRPVPSVLWDLACRHLESLGQEPLRRMLALTAEDARLDRRLARHRGRLIDSVDGILALLHEAHRLEWAAPLLDAAMRGRFGLRAHFGPGSDRGAPGSDRGPQGSDRGAGLAHT